MTEWYYANDGNSYGPFPEDELRRLAQSQVLTRDTLVWSAALSGSGSGWVKAADTEISAIFAQPSRTRVTRAHENEGRAAVKKSRKFFYALLGCMCAVIIAAGTFAALRQRPMNADEFFSLCGAGNADEIISALKNHADPAAKPETYGGDVSTPLIAAILNEKINGPEVVSAFAESGADLDARDGASGFTALMYATAVNKPEIVRALIQNGADVNARDNDGCPALMYAITGNQTAVIAELIRNGADANARDNIGRSAFSLAINPNVDRDTVIELIKSGANVNEFVSFRDDWRVRDVSILMLAIINRCAPEIVAALIDNGANVNAETKYGDTALMFAIAKNSDPETTIALIEHGADVNKKYLVHHGAAFQYTALMWAIVHHNDIEVIRKMISRGADVKARTEYGPSALDCAIYEGYEEAAALLKQHGAR